MDIEEIRLGNALFNTKLVKSMFFVGEPIQICMKGKFRRDVPSGLNGLQASVHGDVQLVGDLVKVKYPFCDINRVGCPGLTQPGCGVGGITAGSDFCFCSQLTEVPTSPDVSINLPTTFKSGPESFLKHQSDGLFSAQHGQSQSEKK